MIEIPNVAADPEAGYEMDAACVLPYVKDDRVASTWHTHPNADPTLSEDDWFGFAMWPDFTHKIIGIRDGEVKINTYRVDRGLVVECS